MEHVKFQRRKQTLWPPHHCLPEQLQVLVARDIRRNNLWCSIIKHSRLLGNSMDVSLLLNNSCRNLSFCKGELCANRKTKWSFGCASDQHSLCLLPAKSIAGTDCCHQGAGAWQSLKTPNSHQATLPTGLSVQSLTKKNPIPHFKN